MFPFQPHDFIEDIIKTIVGDCDSPFKSIDDVVHHQPVKDVSKGAHTFTKLSSVLVLCIGSLENANSKKDVNKAYLK